MVKREVRRLQKLILEFEILKLEKLLMMFRLKEYMAGRDGKCSLALKGLWPRFLKSHHPA